MKRKKHKDNELDQISIEEGSVEPRDLEYAKCSFTFYMTIDEADNILKKPNGQIARKMRKYVYNLVKEAAGRFFTKEEKEDVNNCNEEE